MTTLCVLLAAALIAALLLWQRARAVSAAALQRAAALQAQLHATCASEARYHAGLVGAPGGLLLLDRQARVVAGNAVADELAALPPGSRGRALAQLVSWPQLQASLDACAAHGSAQEFEVADPAQEHGRCLTVRVHSLGEHGFAVGIEDHSRLKRLESLRRDFVANVSHELKTPLAAILGYVETMLDDADMPAQTRHRFLGKMLRQAERLSRLVGDLLTLSRLDEVQLGGETDEIDVAMIVRETVRDLNSLAEKGGIRLVLDAGGGPCIVRADAEGLRQVVGNLVDNAIKYTPHGGEVRVLVARRGGQATIEVADTGIGLSTEDQRRVFERFYRADRARSRDLGGTGLGLSIVKNTVRSLGGDVGVRSTLGKGSTFWVHIPLPLHQPTGPSRSETS